MPKSLPHFRNGFLVCVAASPFSRVLQERTAGVPAFHSWERCGSEHSSAKTLCPRERDRVLTSGAAGGDGASILHFHGCFRVLIRKASRFPTSPVFWPSVCSVCLAINSHEPVPDIQGWVAGQVSPDRVPRHFSSWSTPIPEMLWLLAEAQGSCRP